MLYFIRQAAKNLKCSIGFHEFERMSWEKTDRNSVNWALYVVPVYERKYKCKHCSKEKTEEYISLADKGTLKISSL